MRIPLDLAETLAVVIDEGTLDAAAQRLHVTPSAVSQRIKTLETALGRVLLVRTKPARTTNAGIAVVRLAREAALLEHDALAALGDTDDDAVRMTIPLAVNADSLATWFLPPLARLSREMRVVFDLHRDDQDFTAALLESGTVMGAVTSRATPVGGCRVSALGVMVYEPFATPSFAAEYFAAGVTVEALRTAPMVDYDRRDDLQTRWLRGRGVYEQRMPRHYVPASNDFATAVRLGFGWGMLPRFQSDQAQDSGALVRLEGERIDIPLYWQQWNLRSSVLHAVAEAVIAEGRRVLDPM